MKDKFSLELADSVNNVSDSAHISVSVKDDIRRYINENANFYEEIQMTVKKAVSTLNKKFSVKEIVQLNSGEDTHQIPFEIESLIKAIQLKRYKTEVFAIIPAGDYEHIEVCSHSTKYRIKNLSLQEDSEFLLESFTDIYQNWFTLYGKCRQPKEGSDALGFYMKLYEGGGIKGSTLLEKGALLGDILYKTEPSQFKTAEIKDSFNTCYADNNDNNKLENTEFFK